jgi:hypothetical protein
LNHLYSRTKNQTTPLPSTQTTLSYKDWRNNNSFPKTTTTTKATRTSLKTCRRQEEEEEEEEGWDRVLSFRADVDLLCT